MSQESTANLRLEVFYKKHDPRANAMVSRLEKLGYSTGSVHLADNYLINAPLDDESSLKISEMLVNPVIQDVFINRCYVPEKFSYAVEVGFLPGVTDNISHTVRESVEDLLKTELDHEKSVFCTISYFFEDIDRDAACKIAAELYNPLIQRVKILSKDEFLQNKGFGYSIPVVKISDRMTADIIDLNIPEDELISMGKDGIPDSDGTRRGPLALDLLSMETIKDYYDNVEKRKPTDIEIESIAQTWSEHCKHTIFASAIDDDIPEGIYKTFIREATRKIRKDKGAADFCVSVFTDNAGGIRFDDNYIVSDKVETHNSPSALDPFGGAITGIVGVNRDEIGFGMGAKPIANRYGYCFADPEDEKPLYKNKTEDSKLLSPRRIMEGVVQGVNAGGNTSGIPTPQGFIFFDKRYKGKPLVFVGTIGLIPNEVNGQPSVQKKAMAGDYVVMVGGRVGRDGIHGATFSSEALTSGSPATAVQIGDPITQKKFSDAIVKEARDRNLYNSITDNGAGGLSCSVAEMAKESGGFVVDLEKVPLKYPGLAPWQIWISESQERMTLSVSKDKIDEFISLMKKRGVEATVIGEFNDTTRAVVKYNGKEIFNLDMDFLHDGLPKRTLYTSDINSNNPEYLYDEPSDHGKVLSDMLARLNLCSFEFITSQYDYEVQANSAVKPLQGKGRVNGNVSVIKPVLNSPRGVVLSQGLYPTYSDLDTYWMAACAIDTAIRNAISAGASLDHLAILDNFCWCDSNNPERLGQLKKSGQACYDFAVAYGTPFISGKDSMFNDFKGYDENFKEVEISIPPTLLISSIGVVEDVLKCQTMDFKFGGDLIYIVGETSRELGGSEYSLYRGEADGIEGFVGENVPQVDSVINKKIYTAVERAIKSGLVSSSTSIERGGLAVALAKSSISGGLGVRIDLKDVAVSGTLRDDELLYSESQGRLVLTVAPDKKTDFEKAFSGVSISMIGNVSEDEAFVVKGQKGSTIIVSEVRSLNESYRKTLGKY